jgi:hypothetical protein
MTASLNDTIYMTQKISHPRCRLKITNTKNYINGYHWTDKKINFQKIKKMSEARSGPVALLAAATEEAATADGRTHAAADA